MGDLMIKILHGDIVYTSNPSQFDLYEDGYLVTNDDKVVDVYSSLPKEYQNELIEDYKGKLIIPGLIDLHVHAPQYTYRGLGMDLELIEWLNVNTFPEESKYKDNEYALKAYSIFTNDLLHSSTTRACIFGTVHKEATLLLMDKLEETKLITKVGKVNMDRNCPDYIKESTSISYLDTLEWVKECNNRNYSFTSPILTPRFIPSCTDEILDKLKEIQVQYHLPVQSHLSENLSEIEWVKELCPSAKNYGEAYELHGLFGGEDCPTLMAHCIYSDDEELALMKKNGVYIVHCPESNINVRSGIAPIRKYLDEGFNVGLGSDIAAGTTLNMFKAVEETIKASKMRWRILDQNYKWLSEQEGFYLATKGGGKFFGKVGSFEKDYEFDAVVIDDSRIRHANKLSLENRIITAIYLSDERDIVTKYVKGNKVL